MRLKFIVKDGQIMDSKGKVMVVFCWCSRYGMKHSPALPACFASGLLQDSVMSRAFANIYAILLLLAIDPVKVILDSLIFACSGWSSSHLDYPYGYVEIGMGQHRTWKTKTHVRGLQLGR